MKISHWMLSAATLQHEPTHQIPFGYKAGRALDQSRIMVVKIKALGVQPLACYTD
jgi:hypothetical protein